MMNDPNTGRRSDGPTIANFYRAAEHDLTVDQGATLTA